MKRKSPTARWQFIGLIVILAVVIAGCANVRQGVAWPDLELVTINDNERVLVTFNDRIVAIDPYQGGQTVVARDADGELIRSANGDVQDWAVELREGNNQTFYVAPFRDDNNFVFPTYNSKFVEVDAQTGQLQDELGIPLTDGVIADVIVTDELIYVPYRSGDVVALNAETYDEVWRFETEEGVWASPLLADGILYFGSIDHFLYALDAQTGDVIWDNPVDLEGAIASSPLLADGFLYVGSYSHKLYKISLAGEIVAEYEGSNWVWATPVIVDGTLYYTDLNGYVYALNPDDLTEVWSQRPANRGIRPAPIVTDEFVIVAARNGMVYWLDRETGQTVQEVEVERTPELLSDILYLPADEEAGRPALILVASTENRSLVTAI
ncbi:MAG: PQQ-binding-like beta-propeller repeat protein, partial [Chloroflexota bacterium]